MDDVGMMVVGLLVARPDVCSCLFFNRITVNDSAGGWGADAGAGWRT